MISLINVLGSSNIEPVISLTVRAYDLGIPSLDSEVLVHIFTEQTSSRTMKFIVYEDPLMLQDKKDDFSNLFSAMTGGEAEIQDIQAYSDSNSIDRMDYLQIDYINRWVAKNLFQDIIYLCDQGKTQVQYKISNWEFVKGYVIFFEKLDFLVYL